MRKTNRTANKATRRRKIRRTPVSMRIFSVLAGVSLVLSMVFLSFGLVYSNKLSTSLVEKPNYFESFTHTLSGTVDFSSLATSFGSDVLGARVTMNKLETPITINAAMPGERKRLRLTDAQKAELAGQRIESGPRNTNMVALTFDDGPLNRSDSILNILEETNSSGTFYFVGSRINESNLHSAQAIERSGNELGNHTQDHMIGKLANASASLWKEQIESCNDTFDKFGLKRPLTVRTPEMRENKNLLPVLKETKQLWVGAGIDSRDWEKSATVASVSKKALSAKPGDIILLHETDVTVEALPGIIKEFQKRGIRCVSVEELLASKYTVK